MSQLFRHRIETTIEHLIALLDEMDGDCDLEIEAPEEQHDAEADPTEAGIADAASLEYILAENSRRQRGLKR